MALDYIAKASLIPSRWGFFFYGRFKSFFFFVNICSGVCCDFGVLMRGGKLKSFACHFISSLFHLFLLWFFFNLSLVMFFPSFSTSFRCKLDFLIWDFSVSWGRLVLPWSSLLELFLLCPTGVESLGFHFHLSPVIFISSLFSSLTHWLFSSTLSSLHIFVDFAVFYCNWFHFLIKNAWYDFNLLWPIWRMFHVHLKRMYTLLLA